MSYLILGLGLLLSVCGSVAVYFGYGIVEVERGWASLIAGATALSSGIITIALGLILRSLGKLRAFSEAEKGIQPQSLELAHGRAAPASEPPPDQGLAGERQPDPSELAPPAPRAAEAVAEARPPENIDIERGRARILAARPRENAEAGRQDPRQVQREDNRQADVQENAQKSMNVSRASIEDVRRLVAAKIKGWPQPEPRADSAEGQTAGAGAAQPRIAPVYEIAAEPSRAGDAAKRFGPSPAGGREGGEARGRPATIADAARPPDARSGTIAAPFLAARQAEREGGYAMAPQDSPRPATSQIETTKLASAPRPNRAPAAPETRTDAAENGEPRGADDGLAIVGRYESEGTSYVMYVDGSIDAQSERGVFHFKSMADLKAFIESQG